MRFVVSFLALALAASGLAVHARAQEVGDRLEKVVIVTRHGVRAAMSSPEKLETTSARPWPRFSVPPGHLTPNGAELSRLFGAYYRQLYVAQGGLGSSDCGTFYYWANVTQRTIATAKALSEGLSPGCGNAVHTVGEDHVDPLFDPVGAGVVRPDPALARAAMTGRVGGGLAAWSASHRDAIETLDALLMQCESKPCPPNVGGVRVRIGDAVSGFEEKDSLIVGISGPEAFASGVTESLLMAWADGQDFAALGWKGVDEDTLLRAFALHQAEFDLRLRTPYVAQKASARLASAVLATLQVGETRGAIGEAESRVVVIVGHDGTLAMLGGVLRLDWAVEGYQPGQIPPGGALVFERWRRADGKRVIRARFVAQTLRQLREKSPLTLASPPATSPLFIPGCSTASTAFDCPLRAFGRTVRAAVRP